MTVKIEMEMPKSCMYCRFCIFITDPAPHYWCFAGEHEVKGKRKRYKNCPLQEVKECK